MEKQEDIKKIIRKYFQTIGFEDSLNDAAKEIDSLQLSKERVIEVCKKNLEPFLDGSGLVIFERNIESIASELTESEGIQRR